MTWVVAIYPYIGAFGAVSNMSNFERQIGGKQKKYKTAIRLVEYREILVWGAAHIGFEYAVAFISNCIFTKYLNESFNYHSCL